jgi:hypothetical protein
LTLPPGIKKLKLPYYGSGWSKLVAMVKSRGYVLAEDDATIHPISSRAWIVISMAAAALLSGVAYVFLVVKRR